MEKIFLKMAPRFIRDVIQLWELCFKVLLKFQCTEITQSLCKNIVSYSVCLGWILIFWASNKLPSDDIVTGSWIKCDNIIDYIKEKRETLSHSDIFKHSVNTCVCTLDIPLKHYGKWFFVVDKSRLRAYFKFVSTVSVDVTTELTVNMKKRTYFKPFWCSHRDWLII